MEEILNQLMQHAIQQRTVLRHGEFSTDGNRSLLENLCSDDDECIMTALNEVCRQLNMEELPHVVTINPTAFVPPIIACLKKEYNIDLMIAASRTLNYMADSLPRALQALSEQANVAALLNHVGCIIDVELSEQCLLCIEKISNIPEGAMSALLADGVSKLLAFIDFFTLSSQRKVWATVARICQKVGMDTFDLLNPSFTSIREGTTNGDAKIREKAFLSIVFLIEGVGEKPSHVDAILGDLVDVLIPTLMRPDSGSPAFSSALLLIQTAVLFSPNFARRAIESGLTDIMLSLLDSPHIATTGSPASYGSASPDSGSSPVQSDAHQSSETVAPKRMSMEQKQMICKTLSYFLPPNRAGFFRYLDRLTVVSSAKVAQPGSAGLKTWDGEDAESFVSEVEDSLSTSDDEFAGASSDDAGNLCRLRAKIANSDAKLSANASYASKIGGRHSCDSCNSLCTAGDWYRCNDCPDTDYCALCMSLAWQYHANGEHSFTDMMTVVGSTLPPPKDETETEVERVRMFLDNRHLLGALLKGVPVVVKHVTETEGSDIYIHVMSFLGRVLEAASPEQLQVSCIHETTVCDAIITALRSRNILLNMLGLHVIAVLLAKQPSIYVALFLHEGVVNHLSRMTQGKTSSGTEPASPPLEEDSSYAKIPMDERTSSKQGWRTIFLEVAGALLSSVSLYKVDNSRVGRLQHVSDLLARDEALAAFKELRDALSGDLTPFELTTSHVVHELKGMLSRKNDIHTVMLFASTLLSKPSLTEGANAAASEKGSALHQLVRHLQSILSHLDTFRAPRTVPLKNVHTPITLHLIPHSPRDADRVQCQDSKGKKKQRSESASGTVRAENEGEAAFSGQDASRGRAFTVRIEPLATIGVISDFLHTQFGGGLRGSLGRFFQGSTSRREDDAEEDAVEYVVPDRPSAGEGSERVSRRKKPHFWIRTSSRVLPVSMSLLEVLQLSLCQKNGPRTSLAERKVGLRSDGFISNMTLYYSATPFGEKYTVTAEQVGDSLVQSEDVPKVLLPSEDMQPPAVLDVLTQLRQPFICSARFLSDEQKAVLTLLGTLHAVMRHWPALVHFTRGSSLDHDAPLHEPPVALAEFLHPRLSNKAMRHCCNYLLAGQHAETWAVNLALDCNFLFTSATRKYLFDISFCGTLRSLLRMQELAADYGRDGGSDLAGGEQGPQFTLGRTKKRVLREKPVEYAMEIIGDGEESRAVRLEVEFVGEEGSGPGPTREFFNLVGDGLRKRQYRLWRSMDETEDDQYYSPVNGLYPQPVSPDSEKVKMLEPYFLFIGRFLARCILDERIAMLCLSPVVVKMLRGDMCSVYDVKLISETLGQTLEAMAIAGKEGGGEVWLKGHTSSCTIESMQLDFTVPGECDIALIPNGTSTMVTRENVMRYCDAVVRFLLSDGVTAAVRAMRQGFHEYIPLYSLHMLSVDEILVTLNGSERRVTKEELEENCLVDHGFTMSCCQVQWLLEIVASFDLTDQHQFFLFLTGASHLPAGGLASLRPKMTIVRKTSTDTSVSDMALLPSAMTCQNYLKLPAYDTKEHMEMKLRQAISEGNGAFHLT